MAILTVTLLPGTLQLPAYPAPVSPLRVFLNLPNVGSGSADAPPIQQSGSAQGLPHLVDASLTEPRDMRIAGPRPENDGKRPDGALPVEKQRTPTDEPAKALAGNDKCRQYLSNQDTNMLLTVLSWTAVGAGACTVAGIDSVIGIPASAVCGVIGALAGAGAAAVGGANKAGHGIVIEYGKCHWAPCISIKSQ
ncbi:hypothetical protein [Microbispora sp. H10949]|uniref:hypothetical protein n=1 Tax=Microbispora sp. H10949 TaxID=2729111 RepID=UPI0015FF7829|nr:hypothetical protein [Microbispora sp. H10949]